MGKIKKGMEVYDKLTDQQGKITFYDPQSGMIDYKVKGKKGVVSIHISNCRMLAKSIV